MNARRFTENSAVMVAILLCITFISFGLSERKMKDVEKKLKEKFGLNNGEIFLLVNPENQRLYLIKDENVLKVYTISTSKYGLGCSSGSNKTPVGTHRIKEKIGDKAPSGRIFKGRVDTGKNATIYKDRTDLEEDEVTTRILWLEGVEYGVNRGGTVDSHKRYIYIHGTPEEGLLGEPASHGCIRMKNRDVMELYDKVRSGTLVEILNRPYSR